MAFDTGRVANALVIPVEAMAVVDRQDSCYVVGEDGLSRRSIKTRRATQELLEVTDGLQEGEHVVSRSLDVGDEIAVVDKPNNLGSDVARDQSAAPRIPESSSRSTARTTDRPLAGSANRSTS